MTEDKPDLDAALNAAVSDKPQTQPAQPKPAAAKPPKPQGAPPQSGVPPLDIRQQSFAAPSLDPRFTTPLPHAASPPTVPAQAPPAPKPAPAALPQGRLSLLHGSGGAFGNIWGATLPQAMPLEDCLHDIVWANKAPSMKVGDMIWVSNDKGTFYAQLRVGSVRVVGAGLVANRASVDVILHKEIVPPAHFLDIGDYEISYEGQYLKWCIVRVADKVAIKEGFETKEEAEKARRAIALSKAA